jgi:hypothetical protein
MEDPAAMSSKRIKQSGVFSLKVSEDDEGVAYLTLPTYPETGTCKMSRSVRLSELIGTYVGPDVVLDFDGDGVLVGIELLAD